MASQQAKAEAAAMRGLAQPTSDVLFSVGFAQRAHPMTVVVVSEFVVGASGHPIAALPLLPHELLRGSRRLARLRESG